VKPKRQKIRAEEINIVARVANELCLLIDDTVERPRYEREILSGMVVALRAITKAHGNKNIQPISERKGMVIEWPTTAHEIREALK